MKYNEKIRVCRMYYRLVWLNSIGSYSMRAINYFKVTSIVWIVIGGCGEIVDTGMADSKFA